MPRSIMPRASLAGRTPVRLPQTGACGRNGTTASYTVVFTSSVMVRLQSSAASPVTDARFSASCTAPSMQTIARAAASPFSSVKILRQYGSVSCSTVSTRVNVSVGSR